MNRPTIYLLLSLVLLTACPPPERPSDPEPGPADGDTGSAVAGETCDEELARVKAELAELAECRAPK